MVPILRQMPLFGPGFYNGGTGLPAASALTPAATDPAKDMFITQDAEELKVRTRICGNTANLIVERPGERREKPKIELSLYMSELENKHPEWRGVLGEEDFISTGPEGYRRYIFSPSEKKARLLLNLTQRVLEDLFPELDIDPSMSEEDVVNKLRPFLEAYRVAERLYDNSDVNERHCGPSAVRVVHLLMAKGFKAYAISIDWNRDRSKEPESHTIAAVKIGLRYYLADINQQQFGREFDELVLIPEEEAGQKGMRIATTVAEQIKEFGLRYLARSLNSGLNAQQMIIREKMSRLVPDPE